MTHPAFLTLLNEARKVHQVHPGLRGFCPFPGDLDPTDVTPHHIPAADLMAAEAGLYSDHYTQLRDAFIAAGPHAHWRETYKGTDIGARFMDRFGCYALIGTGGAWKSARMSGFVVYMPPGLHYPMHHHPAEEMYLIIAGQARFMRRGEPGEVLGPGDTSFHASNQPHAAETGDHPVMAYVVWRNHLGTKPVLTDLADRA